MMSAATRLSAAGGTVEWKTPWWRRSLSTRVAVIFLGLLLVLQLTSFTAVRASLSHHAHANLPKQLVVGERVLQHLLSQRAQRLSEGARLLASDAEFRLALRSNSSRELVTALALHAARIGAVEAALLDPDFNLRASTSANPRELLALMHKLADRQGEDRASSALTLLNGLPFQAVLVPVNVPATVAWIIMALPLDQALADEMRALSSLNLTLLTRGMSNQPWVAPLSGLPAPSTAALAALRWTPTMTASPMNSIATPTDQLGVRANWLSRSATIVDGPAVLALMSLSVDDAVRLPQDLQWALLAITSLGLLIFGLSSWFTARWVTQPLRFLSAAADRLGAGDFATPVAGSHHSTAQVDEIGHLSQAFERMRVNVATQQEEILKLAYWDSLTGLPNRTQFRDAVREAVAQAELLNASGETVNSVAVIMLDLARFKHVNDVLGYRFGDLLLSAVATRLSQHSVRGDDLVARLGGDEFAVLLRRGSGELAASVAQRIEHSFTEPLVLEEHKVDMDAGIGMACWPDHASNADTLLNRAEVAMYAAKRRGNGALMYEPSIDAGSAQTLSLLTELRQAVLQNELRLYLQPKLSLDSGVVVGAEALVRWQHPTRGLVPPVQFIPFAERTGFIRQVTIWVFEEAARHWQLLHDEGLNLVLSVNLSTRDLLDTGLPQKFEALLIKHRVPAEAFCLEITESAIMDDPQRALGTLNALSALRFNLSIDDFGTGYSSLAYLKKLPVDELKIDQSFVRNMETDSDDAKIVRSTIDLAHNLGLCVVAEGVENAQVWDMLRELNCDQAQGFHMGKPMPAEQFAAWSSTRLSKQLPQGVNSALLLH
jgi:diguanylate cyclase (GGDEF)-like protein